MLQKNKDMISKKNLKLLNSKLPRGAAQTIVKKYKEIYGTEYSIRYIRLILSGQRTNDFVIKVALEYATQHQEEIEALNSSVEQLKKGAKA